MGSRVRSLILSFVFLLGIVYQTGFTTDYTGYDEEVDKINAALYAAGITKGYVIRDLKGFIALEGTYRNYDEFLSAYFIAQAVAGVSKVNPAFNIVNANIVVRETEKCIAYVMSGDITRCENTIPFSLRKETPVISEIPEKVPSKKKKSAKKKQEIVKVSPSKIALLVAVGKYKDPNIPPLGDAPINDALLVKDILEKNGYKVHLLTNEEATKANVKNKITQIVEHELKDGGTFFFYASTHGAPKNPYGETGIVLYDTEVVLAKGEACSTLKKALEVSNETITQSEKEQEPQLKEEKSQSKGMKIFDWFKRDSKKGEQRSDREVGEPKIKEETRAKDEGFLGKFKEFLKKQQQKEAAKSRDIIVTAQKMCHMLKNSITISEDILPLIESSKKEIRFISSLDVCYSGMALKEVLGLKKPMDIYTNDPIVIENLGGVITKPFAYISSASGEELSMQKYFEEMKRSHGVFTYYYYTSLPKYYNDINKTYSETKNVIKGESASVCRNLRTVNQNERCNPEGQNPLVFINKKIRNTTL